MIWAKKSTFCLFKTDIEAKNLFAKGGFRSEDTGEFLHLQHKYSKLLSWAENLNKLFTVMGVKFKFSAQDRDLEYLFWRSKNLPVPSDIIPPLIMPLTVQQICNMKHKQSQEMTYIQNISIWSG